jgi:hypothetical protein
LIAATEDAGSTMAWSNITDTSVGTTRTAIGDGQANTTLIVNQSGCTSGAAYYCYYLVKNGFSDWFLPSKNELNKLYLNRVAIGDFADYYWSSSENTAYTAWYQHFGNGNQNHDDKTYYFRVRAVRAF